MYMNKIAKLYLEHFGKIGLNVAQLSPYGVLSLEFCVIFLIIWLLGCILM